MTPCTSFPAPKERLASMEVREERVTDARTPTSSRGPAAGSKGRREAAGARRCVKRRRLPFPEWRRSTIVARGKRQRCADVQQSSRGRCHHYYCCTAFPAELLLRLRPLISSKRMGLTILHAEGLMNTARTLLCAGSVCLRALVELGFVR